MNSLLERAPRWLFWPVVVAWLVPIWWHAYFVTNDGACHLYNARVLLDWWCDRGQAFYAKYYELNRLVVPNQFVHWCLALLQTVLTGVIAEKVLFSAYVLAFVSGFRFLLRTIRPGAEFLVFLALPFMMSRPLIMGFLNYSFSLVTALWLVAFWLRRRSTPNLGTAAVLGLALLVQYLMHPVGLALSLLTMAACSAGGWLADRAAGRRAATRQLGQEALLLAVAALPALLLLGVYLFQLNQGTSPSPLSTLERWHAFCRQDALVGLTKNEAGPLRIVAPGLGCLLLIGLFVRRQGWRLAPADAFLGLSLLLFGLYLQAPDGGAGGSILVMRLEGVPLLWLLPWLALVPWPAWSRLAMTAVGIVLSATLLIVRWPIQRQVAIATADYLSVAPHIEPYTTVLPLSFNHSGQVPGVPHIPSLLWQMMHTADYLGVARAPLVMLGNYEANTHTFPLLWLWQRNPFAHLATGEGLEAQPPSVNIDNYEQQGGQVDYVLLWCARDNFASHPTTRALREVLARDYKQIAVSPLGYAELFEKRMRRHWQAW